MSVSIDSTSHFTTFTFYVLLLSDSLHDAYSSGADRECREGGLRYKPLKAGPVGGPLKMFKIQVDFLCSGA